MAVTRQSLLEEIRGAIDQNERDQMAHSLGYWGPNSGTLGAQAKNSFNRITQLKDLLGMMGDSESGSGVNPFGVGSGGGAPTMSTSNRFESGLTDAETRLRNLLDNPDSIQQSAAYKFRVGQGAEALQRSLGAKGLLNSGNRLMELIKYGQDMGSQEYDAQAGRLGNLLGNYSQSWIGDKNANTGAFSAQANAWNTAQGNADRNRLGFAQLNWEKSKPQFVSGGSRSSSGGSTFNAGGITGSWNPDTDPTIQRMRRDAGWNYDYSQGGQSLWTNKHTGEQSWQAGGRENNPTKNEYYNTPAWGK